MPITAVAGGQWGDEGKGKVVDLLAQSAQVVVRAQGGDNAGHTIVNPAGMFKLRLVPAGIFNPRTLCVIGPGVALNPAGLVAELDALNQRGVNTHKLLVSPRAHLVLPYHRLLDRLEDAVRRGRLGTTGRGIGPAYVDKVSRQGLRAGDLLQPDALEEKLTAVLAQHNPRLQALGGEPLQAPSLLAELLPLAERLKPHLQDPVPHLRRALQAGETVLVEGAQGTLLDLDHGTYPFVTSSSPSIGGLLVGAGLGPSHLRHAVGVFKAYCTRVGEGPMPTELHDATGEALRQRGQEFGTVTGRPRRCGGFDAVAGRYARLVNGCTSLALTRLDVLSGLERLRLATAYELDGERLEEFPPAWEELARCRPVYEELPGWQEDLGGARALDDLPPAAQAYVKRIEELLDCPVGLVGVGEERGAAIALAAPFV